VGKPAINRWKVVLDLLIELWFYIVGCVVELIIADFVGYYGTSLKFIIFILSNDNVFEKTNIIDSERLVLSSIVFAERFSGTRVSTSDSHQIVSNQKSYFCYFGVWEQRLDLLFQFVDVSDIPELKQVGLVQWSGVDQNGDVELVLLVEDVFDTGECFVELFQKMEEIKQLVFNGQMRIRFVLEKSYTFPLFNYFMELILYLDENWPYLLTQKRLLFFVLACLLFLIFQPI
jgi:hypothetical protein